MVISLEREFLTALAKSKQTHKTVGYPVTVTADQIYYLTVSYVAGVKETGRIIMSYCRMECCRFLRTLKLLVKR